MAKTMKAAVVREFGKDQTYRLSRGRCRCDGEVFRRRNGDDDETEAEE